MVRAMKGNNWGAVIENTMEGRAEAQTSDEKVSEDRSEHVSFTLRPNVLTEAVGKANVKTLG